VLGAARLLLPSERMTKRPPRSLHARSLDNRQLVTTTGGLDAASGIATGQRSHTVVILDKGDLDTVKGGSGKIWQDDWLAPV
jgi:hypothetical protein